MIFLDFDELNKGKFNIKSDFKIVKTIETNDFDFDLHQCPIGSFHLFILLQSLESYLK